MSRIPLVERDNASAEVNALFDRADGLGFSLFNVFKLWANNTKAATGLLDIAEALYGDNKLSARYRELAYLRASQVNSCHY
jgi:alkylhydroperoxidase family enzyme